MSNTGLECGNPWPHDPHQYNDSGVYRACPGLQEQPPAPAVCRSPRCTRPGTSGSGWCCYGCAAHTRFGRELLHNLPCETANPGEEETTDTLRDRIVAAALTVPIRLGPATIRNAQAGQNVTRLSGAEADHIAHVVMDVLANRADAPPRADQAPHE